MKLNQTKIAAIRRTMIDYFLAKNPKPKINETNQQAKPPFEPKDLFDKIIKMADRAALVKYSSHQGRQTNSAINSAAILNVDLTTMPALPMVGSHALGATYVKDVAVLHAGSLGVAGFLQMPMQSQSIIELLQAGNKEMIAALHDDPDKAASIAKKLLATLACNVLASHALNKQPYWLTGADVHDNTNYHLLTILSPASLVHRVNQLTKSDFEENQAKRKARREGEYHPLPIVMYPEMLTIQIGGEQPQNVSMLNSKSGGEYRLLASLPPIWRRRDSNSILKVKSIFDELERQAAVRELVGDLKTFLESDPPANFATRKIVTDDVNQLLDLLANLFAVLKQRPADWTSASQLPEHQRAWVDVSQTPTADQLDAMAHQFGNWLNEQLRTDLPMGDMEHANWKKLAIQQFKSEAK